MTHIANCMKRSFGRPDFVYIMEETSALLPSPGNSVPGGPPHKLDIPEHGFKYQLWPQPLRTAPASAPLLSDKSMALAMGRSPTSLSDTSVNPEKNSAFWRRGGSLSNRRKISVPELHSNPKMIPVQETAVESTLNMDSPTIPGRPPLRKFSSAEVHHERSSSAPNWRDCVFGEAMTAGVTAPAVYSATTATSASTPWPPSATQELLPTTYNPTRPLSPILSPSTTPRTAVHVPSSAKESNAFPPLDVPPKVPPKSPHHNNILSSSPPRSATKTFPPQPRTLVKRSNSKSGPSQQQPLIIVPPAAPSATSPKPVSPEPPPTFSPANSAANSPSTSCEPRMSPSRAGRHSPTLTASPKEAVSDLTIMDRGRPIRRNAKKSADGSAHTPAHASANANRPPSPDDDDSAGTAKEPEPDGWTLPVGLKPIDALLVLPEPEKEHLRQQATGQAEQFEVLGVKHVDALSRELRALDERCEYLRKTYKSLRSGRQKLHMRMITYLKTEAISFSRERLLKQEEALIELDKSIDDWIVKLERAENRRLRVRQKLLEHVAAAVTLNSSHASPSAHGQTTPPGSPPRVESPQPLRVVDRKEVESIKVYADYINLFTDIERAVERMCEAC